MYKILLIIILIVTIILLYIQNNKEKYTLYNDFEYSDKLTVENIKNIHQGQKIMNESLLFFKNICDKNNLKYWAIGGTLIGAMRHEGWIPWDGDIDLGMMEDDFLKFKEIMDSEIKSPLEYIEKYPELGCIRNNKAMYRKTSWGNKWDVDKGVQLDIFIFKHDKENNIIKSNRFAVAGNPGKRTMEYNRVFPLKKLKFEGMEISVPNDYKKIATELWGGNPPPLLEKNRRYPHESIIEIIEN
jgi:phosphorylcholine metabolism protein LicD